MSNLTTLPVMSLNPFKIQELDVAGRDLTGTVASSGGGIRTPDTRIMIPLL